MRLKAGDEDVFKLMDLKELFLVGAGGCILSCGLAVYLFQTMAAQWDFIYLAAASMVGGIILIFKTIKINRQIMEADRCYLHLDIDSLVVCQPEKYGRYELCRIFYNEMEKIVEGSRRGIPEFYIVIKKNLEDRQSFILLGEEEQERFVFCVHSFGHEKQAFQEFYRKLRWEVPGKVHIFGTKHQEIWHMKRVHSEIFIIMGILICYLIPKIIEILI